jgi:hypothetical protein
MKTLMLTALVASPAMAGVATDYTLTGDANGIYELLTGPSMGVRPVAITFVATIQQNVFDSGLDGCDINQVAPTQFVFASTTVAYAFFQPCGAQGVIVKYHYGSAGLYEEARTPIATGGLGNHRPSFGSMTVGPNASLNVLVNAVEQAAPTIGYLYNEYLQLLETLTDGTNTVNKFQIGPSGKYFYVCESWPDVLTGVMKLYEFKGKGNVLTTQQPTLPVPFDSEDTYTAIAVTAYCSPEG